jgi:hypothetical protein
MREIGAYLFVFSFFVGVDVAIVGKRYVSVFPLPVGCYICLSQFGTGRLHEE